MGDFDRSKIRNICILAHVDHGKTTLADHLIAACGGGILHPKLAGRLRYMDYLDEEQRRAITMKSSSIALQYQEYSINLIDSPGHMDFCSEVSTAARLSDGALVLVDAVEGVHIQTHAVLRQAWVEKLTPCLVLNKIDRLITELKLTPMEAYNRLQRIIHEINGIVSAYKSEKYLSDVDSLIAGAGYEVDLELLDEDDEEVVFQPQKGNVAFACALDGWGFCISQFAEFYAAKQRGQRMSMTALLKGLWGPRYFIKEKGMIVGKRGVEGIVNPQPMFVQFVLEPLWQVYNAALDVDGDKGRLDKLIKNFNLSIPDRELRNKDPKAVLQAIMSRWLPLSDAVLSMVVKCMPDPISSQSARISRLLPKKEVMTGETVVSTDVVAEAEHVRKCVETCDSSVDAPAVAFVSKMFAVPYKMLPQRGHDGRTLNNQPSSEGESECFLAFARIFSGVLHCDQKVFVLSALYDPVKGESMQRHVQEAELHSLYLMMGQGLKPVQSACAGNVVAIRGLGQQILKSATLSSTRNCWPFSSMMFQVAPNLRVAIEPSDPADMGALTRGLRLLNRADPFVEITVSSRGEHVLAAAGEVHLERCIKDLKERFSKVSLEVSPPLVSFKETIESDALSLIENSKAPYYSNEYVEKTTSNGRCTVRVHVMKLPRSLTKVLEDSASILEDILVGQSSKKDKSSEMLVSNADGDSIAALRKRILDAIESEIETAGGEIDEEMVERTREMWFQMLRRIWSLGPRQIGPNILLVPDSRAKADTVAGLSEHQRGILIRGPCDVSKKLGFLNPDVELENGLTSVEEQTEELDPLYLEAEALKSSVVSGFQFATSAGPLCDEPMWGLAFLIEPYIFQDNSDASNQADQYGMFSGQVMTAVKEACRAAVLQTKPRLVEAMYFCELNTPPEILNRMYAVLAKRRAKVLKEEMREGSPLFTVHAYVPVAESFGFNDELRRWTSGAASALLVLSHWETIPEDPFFVPRTEEEIEEHGDGSSVLPNIARKLMNSVRRRKGLRVEEKIVQHATKQRTLARKTNARKGRKSRCNHYYAYTST